MTIKTLTGTYSAGYTLSDAYTGLDIATGARVTGFAGARGSRNFTGPGGDGGVGGTGVTIPFAAPLINQGAMVGGAGGAGGAGYNGGGSGGSGGAAVVLAAGASLDNIELTVAGHGGNGGRALYAGNGGAGGAGGAGAETTDGAAIVNTGAIFGGRGGRGGYGSGPYSYEGGAGGAGGAGVDLAAGASLSNTDEIGGGHGGRGGRAAYYGVGGTGGAGGDGVDLAAGAAFSNDFHIDGGTGGRGGYGSGADTYGGAGGAGGAGATLAAGANLANLGTVTGGLGGFGGSSALHRLGAAGAAGDGVDLAGGASVSNGSAADGAAIIEGRVGVYAAGGDVTVVNFGVIEGTGGTSVLFASASDRLVAEAGSRLVGVAQGGGGTLDLAGGTGAITGLGGAGTVSGAVAMRFAGFGAYVLDAHSAWSLGGTNALAAGQSLVDAGSLTLGGALANAGLVEALDGGQIAFVRAQVAGAGGTILAGDGSTVTLANTDIRGGTLHSAGDGAFLVVGSGDVLDGTASPLVNAATLKVQATTALTIEGTIVNLGRIELNASPPVGHARLQLAGNTTFIGGGTIALTDAANNDIQATAGETLVNLDNTITGGGAIGGGGLNLINAAAGVIDASSIYTSLILDTVGATIENAGLLEATGRSGMQVNTAIDNAGVIEAAGGNVTTYGAVTGTGVAVIAAGMLDFQAAFDQVVTFTGASGVLALAMSQDYHARIAGFSAAGGTSLDLEDIGFAGAGEATFSGTSRGGTLTVSDGVHTANIRLVGDYLNAVFTAASDGTGGTTVTASPGASAPPAAHRLAAAMAAMAAPPVGAARLGGYGAALPPLLARPHTQTA